MSENTDKVDKDDKLVREAQKRFGLCQDAESEFRELFLNDLRFAHGNADNGYQWPQEVRSARQLEKKPCLTINKTKQHNRQITNQARENKPSVRVSPVDDGADVKTAEIINGIIRHIEVNSNADTAYDTAAEFAVDGGIGYWRITTDYASDESFDQEIFIRRVKNPLNVYLDPNIQEADGSDARYGFVFENIEKEEFEARYPDFDAIGWPMAGQGDEWLSSDKIRLAEYFYATEESDWLIVADDGSTSRMSEAKDEDKAFLKGLGSDRKRQIKVRKIKWCLIAGDQILERHDWAGQYIPIVRVVGEEVDIDGKTHRQGHTRDMKDPQRMYNYWSSSATEHVALQNKIPYVGPAEAREGYEQYWDTANTVNHGYLPYNHVDDTGQPIPPPQRQNPPVMASAYMQGMQVAQEEMKMASGQYDASFGANPSTQSGKALNTLQRKGDLANFHFIDNIARAIKYTGKILVDLIPKIYDTPRVMRILGEDGAEDMVKLDPNQDESMKEVQDEQGQIQQIYNPGVGRYDVVVAVGPSYTTRRAEAFEALTQLAQGNPRLLEIAGDLIMKAADFPMADQLAERLAKTLPPGLQGDGGQNPEQAQAQQQMQEMNGHIQALTQELGQAQDDRDIKLQELTVDRYKAETERLKTIYPTMPPQLSALLAQEFGIQVVQSPDIYPGAPPEQPPGLPNDTANQPPQGGFFTPPTPEGLPPAGQPPA